ncbi:MAG: biotin carboxyl carrier protein [Armatimonadota bacterium]|nr:biotin carboxyl carrier protein [Armatimonadota bacterium]MDR7442975.1 biotin carboxyl carrier protein [Armatimonadota bacterium]MDR7569421.1 biotin carboxyl carrier protein [Armatimonadota bacterium]MDR7614570.1 biotin carboxyl carrier protein [Armatimonadota bacterium]
MDPVRLVDTTLRDGAQSLWASDIPTRLIAEVAEDLVRAEFQAVEVPVNPIYFKKFVRDLREDPWEMCRVVARVLRDVTKACMGAVSLNPFAGVNPRCLTMLFFERVAALGALNRAQLTANTMDQPKRLFPWLVPFLRSLNYQIVFALSYTLSPRHTDAYYAEKTRELLAFKPDAIYLKDQGGLLTPDRVRTLLPAILEAAGDVPVELHSHCTTGLAPLCYLEAIQLGVRVVHTAIPPLANGSSQPSVFNVMHNARYVGVPVRVKEEAVRAASERLWAFARREGRPVGMPLEYDYGQYVHQVPGGVISNLRFQLRELRMEHRLQEVLEEIVRVRADLGYPIMITPYSQHVATQAALNVLTGERYQLVTDEVIRFALGAFGEDSGYTWMDPEVKDRILGRARAREIAAQLEALREEEEAPLEVVRQKLGMVHADEETLLLHCIMKGEGEVQGVKGNGGRAAGASRNSLAVLLERLSAQPQVRYVAIQKGNTSLVLRSA